jgi:hypothetical protein
MLTFGDDRRKSESTVGVQLTAAKPTAAGRQQAVSSSDGIVTPDTRFASHLANGKTVVIRSD